MMDANIELTPDESEFAGQHHGLIRRGDTWYRLQGWGTADDWRSCPLVRVPDDHAMMIIGVDPVHPDDIAVFRRMADCYHPTTPEYQSLQRILRAIEP